MWADEPVSDREPLVISQDHAWPPFSFADQDGQPRGLIIDLWETMEERLGRPVEFKLVDWPETIEQVREGRADLHGGLFPSSERAAFFDFTTELVPLSAAVFVASRLFVLSLDELGDTEVGVVEGSYELEFIRNHHPELVLRLFPNNEAMVRAAAEGQLKAFAADYPVGLYLLDRHANPEDFRPLVRLYSQSLVAGVRRGDRGLLEELNRALATLTEDDLRRLTQRWIRTEKVEVLPRWIIFASGGVVIFLVLAVTSLLLFRERKRLEGEIKRRTRELEEQKELFRTLTENAAAGTYIVEEGRFIAVNPAMATILGRPQRELLETDILDFVHPGDREVVAGRMQARLEGREVSGSYEVRILTGDGVLKWIEVTASPMVFQGKPGSIGTVYDITARKDAERDLQAKVRFEHLISTISSKMITSDAGHVDALIHDGLASIGSFSGADRAYVFQFLDDGTMVSNTHEWCADGIRPQKDHLQSLDLSQVAPWFLKLIRERRLCHVPDLDHLPPEACLEKELFQAQDIQSLLTVPMVSGDRLIGFLGFDAVRERRSWMPEDRNVLRMAGEIFANAVERKRVETALAESQERYVQLAEQGRTFLWEVDATGLYTYLSPVCEKVIGYRPEELVGKKTFYAICPPEDRETNKKLGFGIMERRETIMDLENRIVHKDGRIIWVASNGMTMLDSDGRPIGFRGADTDISEKKRAEEESKKLQAQLIQARKMESVGRLAGGVAHDFNNLLGVILGQTEIALDELGEDHPVHGILREIKQAAQRSTDLTRQLLAFARRQTIAPRVLDLNQTVDAVLPLLRRLVGDRVELSWTPDEDLWRVKVDPAQIDQILANLCLNARDAVGGKGRIEIQTSNAVLDEAYRDDHPGAVPGEYVLLSVADDGNGIQAEILDKIFEPFFSTKKPGEGTGLGLATVYGIVKQNQGYIEADSKPNRGTRMKVYLPREATVSDVEPTAEVPPPPARGEETILIAEDELAILRTATLILERLGYKVMAAASPAQALEWVRERPGEVDLLLTDVVMPEMNGRELAERVHQLDPRIGCLFMSGYTANVIDPEGRLQEDFHFIQKPFSMSSLAGKVREVLDQGPVRAGARP